MKRPHSRKNESASGKDQLTTDAGIKILPLYSPDYTSPRNESKIGAPGSFPFTRGIYPEMYRKRLWTMRQYSGFGTASDTNLRFKYLLKSGQTGLSVAFDLPTQLGLDSDHPRARGEVGKVGVAVSTLPNMQQLFEGIDIAQISTSMTINATASTMLAMYIASADARGLPHSALRGTTQNDILKEYAARNTYIYPPEPSFQLCIDLIIFCAREMPEWHPISISGYHIREAGANAVQELAFTFANALEYVRAASQRGVSIEEVGSKLSFFFACRNDFFEELAKFRAARRIWAKIMKENFGSKNEDLMKLKFHAQTSGETLTAQQPLNNVVRVAIQALASVLGGAQSLHTNSYDEALGLPSEKAATVALRTQQIIAEETGVTATPDPAGGSYYLEELTDELEARAMQELEKVERMGGALSAIKSGYIQNEIQKSAYQFQKQIDSGAKAIVGVNKYLSESEMTVGAQKISGQSARKQQSLLRKFKASRDPRRVERALSKLQDAASLEVGSRINLMPLILAAVKEGATTGDISTTLRDSFGEYHPSFT